MFSTSEITAGANRLTANKLTAFDRKTLLNYFRLYLKKRVGEFPDLADRLAALNDQNQGDKTAATLGALVNYFEDNGGALAELAGGRSGLRTDEAGEMVLKLRYGLVSLDYILPEDFNGSIEADQNSGGGISSGVMLFGTMSVKKDLSGW